MTQQLLKSVLKTIRKHEDSGSLFLGCVIILIALFMLLFVFIPKLSIITIKAPQVFPSPTPVFLEKSQGIPLKQSVRTYTTTGIDTLWKIAVLFYKDGYQWTKIYEANKAVIPNPNILEKNLELVIPD